MADQETKQQRMRYGKPGVAMMLDAAWEDLPEQFTVKDVAEMLGVSYFQAHFALFNHFEDRIMQVGSVRPGGPGRNAKSYMKLS